MASNEFPLSVVNSPLVMSPFASGFLHPGPPLNQEILTELGSPIDTELNQPLLI